MCRKVTRPQDTGSVLSDEISMPPLGGAMGRGGGLGAAAPGRCHCATAAAAAADADGKRDSEPAGHGAAARRGRPVRGARDWSATARLATEGHWELARRQRAVYQVQGTGQG